MSSSTAIGGVDAGLVDCSWSGNGWPGMTSTDCKSFAGEGALFDAISQAVAREVRRTCRDCLSSLSAEGGGVSSTISADFILFLRLGGRGFEVDAAGFEGFAGG